MGSAAADLAATVRSSLDTVRAVQAVVARSKAINRCIGQFNSLVTYYERYSEGSTDPREVDALRQLRG